MWQFKFSAVRGSQMFTCRWAGCVLWTSLSVAVSDAVTLCSIPLSHTNQSTAVIRLHAEKWTVVMCMWKACWQADLGCIVKVAGVKVCTWKRFEQWCVRIKAQWGQFLIFISQSYSPGLAAGQENNLCPNYKNLLSHKLEIICMFMCLQDYVCFR